jgi:hypothetical protein
MPELYRVPADSVAGERAQRGSAKRVPAGRVPYLSAQSFYILAQLLMEGFLTPAELDPLSRRLCVVDKRPPTEVQGLCGISFHYLLHLTLQLSYWPKREVYEINWQNMI